MKRTYRAILVLVITSGLLALLGPVLSRAQNTARAPLEPRWDNGESAAPARDGMMSTLHWAAPDPGQTVHHYLVQLLEFGPGSPDTTVFDGVTGPSLEVFVRFGSTFQARVAAIDSLGVQGPFGPWTGSFTPEMPFH